MGSGAMARLALAAALLCLLAVAADISPDAEFSLAGGSPAQHGDRVAREAQPANRNAQQKKDKRISERQRLRQRKDMSKIKVLQKQKNKRVQKSEKKLKSQNKNKKNNHNQEKRGKRMETNLRKQKKNTKKAKKSKLTKKKKKKQQDKRKMKTVKDATCRGPRVVTDECLINAMESLKYEKNQVTNYLKQSKRLDNHQNISSNKLNKQDEFQSAAKHMLWAIGGNISDPKCGAADESKRAINVRGLTVSVENYNTLLNCSESIKEACDIDLLPTYNKTEQSESSGECEALKADFKKISRECVSAKDQANATLQCECWGRAYADVVKIKKLKCETKEAQKAVTKHKNNCIKAFGVCKKLEDAAIELIHICMHDHSNELINMTAAGLHENAEKEARKRMSKEENRIFYGEDGTWGELTVLK